MKLVNIEGFIQKLFEHKVDWKLAEAYIIAYLSCFVSTICFCLFADVDFKMNYMHWIIIDSPRAAWHVFHAEHQQPWGSDEEEEAAEAGEEAAAVQEQGLLLCVLSSLFLSLSSLLFLLFLYCSKILICSGRSSWHWWNSENLWRGSQKRGGFVEQHRLHHNYHHEHHPQVHLQTQQSGKISIVGQTIKIVKNEGILGLYAGLSASLVRQLTYSTTRFAIYEVRKGLPPPIIMWLWAWQ